MSGRWELFVTDQLGERQAQVDVYVSCEAVAKVNDVSTWTVTLPADTDGARFFATQPFARLEIVLDAAVWRSGPITQFKREVNLDGDTVTASGVDDTAWLARRVAHPQPGSLGPPYSTTAEDIHTGPIHQVLCDLVNVNAGPGAIPARSVPGLSIAPVVGPAAVIIVKARWDNLLTLCQNTAAPWRAIFAVRDLTFEARFAQDRGAIFSEGFGTLAGWVLTSDAPTANQVYVAGGGEGVDRIIRESVNLDSYGAWGRVETFVDQRQTVDPVDLDKAAAEALATGVKPVTVAFTPIDTPTQAFGHDWTLGDTVTVVAGDLIVVDQVREVHVKLDAAGASVTPSVGQASGDLNLFRKLAGLDRRVRQLERI
jgi:hypothetical protein